MYPTLFEYGPIKVHTYGILVMLGFLAAIAWGLRTAARRNIPSDTVLDLALWTFLPGLLGARLLFVAMNWHEYQGPLDIIRVWEGGLSFHGGLLGGILGGVFFCRVRGLSAWELADLVAPSLALAYAIGRIGCLLYGCCYGSACDLPWAMQFHDLERPGQMTPPSHPAQIYSSLSGFAMFGLLAWLDQRRRYPGQVFLAFMMLYSVYRFMIEYVRAGATAHYFVLGLTEAQVASVVLLVLSVITAAWRSRSWSHRAAPEGKPL